MWWLYLEDIIFFIVVIEFVLIIENCKLIFFICGKFFIVYCKLLWLKSLFDVKEVFKNIFLRDFGYFNILSSFFDYIILVILRLVKVVREEIWVSSILVNNLWYFCSWMIFKRYLNFLRMFWNFMRVKFL